MATRPNRWKESDRNFNACVRVCLYSVLVLVGHCWHYAPMPWTRTRYVILRIWSMCFAQAISAASQWNVNKLTGDLAFVVSWIMTVFFFFSLLLLGKRNVFFTVYCDAGLVCASYRKLCTSGWRRVSFRSFALSCFRSIYYVLGVIFFFFFAIVLKFWWTVIEALAQFNRCERNPSICGFI